MKFSQLVIATLCAGALLGGCKGKDGDPGPAGSNGATGPAGPVGTSLTGNIIGFVTPRDEFGRPQAKSGVTVSLENTSPMLTVTSDANGRYEFANVKSGTYNIAFSKVGYGITKIQGYPHAGGDQPTLLRTRPIDAISTTAVPIFAIGSVVGPNVNGNYTRDFAVPVSLDFSNINLPSQNYSLRGILFVGSTPSVTSATGSYVQGVGSSGSSPFYFSRSTFTDLGLTTGSTAYAVVYGASSYYSENGYIDPQTGRNIYTTLSATPSQVVSFIVP